MNTTADSVRETARTASTTGAFVEKAAGAASGSQSKFARVIAGISSVQLGARLLPAGLRIVRRYPLASALVIAGALWIAWSARSRRSAGLDY
jgi:xanthine/uracil/vitamin C permease (AzgA family)